MSYRTNVAYLYDGSLDGFLCCVFDSFAKKILPCDIISNSANQLSLFPIKPIATDTVIAKRVYKGIVEKISLGSMQLIENAFFSCLSQKELVILDFIRQGLKIGPSFQFDLTNDTVSSLKKAETHLFREVMHYKGFIRFSVNDNVLISVIEPKNFILPYLAHHFSQRYSNFPFVIYDKTHGAMLIYKITEYFIVKVDNFTPPEADENELEYRRLWKNFYDSVAIEGRLNNKARISLMSKRFWNNMPEVNGTI